MSSEMHSSPPLVQDKRLAAQFHRLGWIGFWIQVALLVVPILLLVYVVLARGGEPAKATGIDLANYLSYGSLLVLVFTTFWFHRYTLLSQQMVHATNLPSQSDVVRTVWIGIWAGCLGIVFSMLLLTHAVGRMLFILLATPQTGIMIGQPLGSDPSHSISAADAVSLTSVVIILAAELIVLGLSLWLLYQTLKSSGVFEGATAEAI